MKKFVQSAMVAIVMVASFNAKANDKIANDGKNDPVKVVKEEESSIPAIRLISKPDGSSSFEVGTIKCLQHLNTSTFWMNNSVEDWEKDTHKAPRRQYVVTLKGRIKFKVTDGSTFIVKPGTVLLAEDTSGKGHSWEMEDEDDNTWVRLYIPITEGKEDFFVPNK
ncbi:hypothetical protein SAMN05443634_10969 [Chishuiella changwenlii]|uniref:Cupin domain-containing protein n=1 Tax=Chishuiella changwenlii TaxID=1434701 RepID=A0A1M7AK71_9FLAO|nr:hypothetical protein [Chishuiella changwenlii]GGE90569.1 hypothetical protein GCM10010984_05370 [Chishuiella changwenlii]SHL43182.1 hypothetical protein SAMN05443634_10969 [Chishuiella changwenlii]